MRCWLVLALFMSGCASVPLPPHVYIQIPHVDGADLFWWTDTQQCQIRVVYEDPTASAGEVASFTVPIDNSVCLAWLNAEGFDVKKVVKP